MPLMSIMATAESVVTSDLCLPVSVVAGGAIALLSGYPIMWKRQNAVQDKMLAMFDESLKERRDNVHR
jgi:hypothetical protein